LETNLGIHIDESDLERCLSKKDSEGLLDQALQKCIGDPKRLARFAALYVTFNAPFVSGVAALSSAISARPDLFRDKNAPSIIADRAAEVARRVHDAVVDEFLDRTQQVSHRTLAQAFLKILVSSVNSNLDALGRLAAENDTLTTCAHEVIEGYGKGQSSDDKILFAIGWHMGSEVLADDEFNRIDVFLNRYYRDLVLHLKESKVSIDEMTCGGYFWIEIHTSVEKDHFQLATEAAQMALKYYTGERGSVYAKEEILRGFTAFAETQKNMLKALGNI
jgi:hypothetical protein